MWKCPVMVRAIHLPSAGEIHFSTDLSTKRKARSGTGQVRLQKHSAGATLKFGANLQDDCALPLIRLHHIFHRLVRMNNRAVIASAEMQSDCLER